MAYSAARDTLGLTEPAKIDLPKISFTAKEIDLLEWKGDLIAIGVTEKDAAKDENSKFKNSVLQILDSKLNGLLSEVSLEEEFTGKAGQVIVLRLPNLGPKRVCLVGLGSTKSVAASYRSLGEAVAAVAKSVQAGTVAVAHASTQGIPVEGKLSAASSLAAVSL